MLINLPDETGKLTPYRCAAQPLTEAPLSPSAPRAVLAAAHVVADPFAANEPSRQATVDWPGTLAFRRHLHGLGLGIAEAMDTAQRGMGLDWAGALELIRQTRSELPDALVFNGCGTDHLDPADAASLADVIDAYKQQIDAIQAAGGRLVIMASRALAWVAQTPDDYIQVYDAVLAACDAPVILHWLGEMFDPALAGYWGGDDFTLTMETALTVITNNTNKVDGIKMSLLDKDKEVMLRRRLPAGVKMYSGDDFNYPELIAGDAAGYSDALLGVFDPIAVAAAGAINHLASNQLDEYYQIFNPTVPLARLIFRAPTQYYKTGVVFLAWLNGFQDHFVMLGGAQSMRPLPYFADCFKLADQAGVLRDPEMAADRMRKLLAVYGVA